MAAAAQDIVQQWSALASHPNLSTPTEAFVTAQLEGGPTLVLVHAYYPAAITLDQAHMHQASGAHCSPCQLPLVVMEPVPLLYNHTAIMSTASCPEIIVPANGDCCLPIHSVSDDMQI